MNSLHECSYLRSGFFFVLTGLDRAGKPVISFFVTWFVVLKGSGALQPVR
jgi:hypothetical protein